MLFRRFFNALMRGLAVAAIPFAAHAQSGDADPRMQMLFVGVDPAASAPGELPADLPVIAVDSLPPVDGAQQAIFAARLRSNPVSTFVSSPSENNAQFEQFFLVSQVDLVSDAEGFRIAMDGDSFALDDYADRVSALVDAFKPLHRRIGFLRISDAADEFPLAIGQVQSALNRIGFDMMVVMIGGGTGAACSDKPTQALHYSLVSGLADREPFGNGDGQSTVAEVEAYLSAALNRQVARDPACAPKYSLLLKSSNDPDQTLVSYKGRAMFTEVETRLYNETFEAMFLMGSDNPAVVNDFLTSCLYCPSEDNLTSRLRDMEEHARAAALESEIWNRIKDDTQADRLAIYLENCNLCTYREEVETRIAGIEARARAFDAEKARYETALEARDLDSLRAYVSDCVACAFTDAAKGHIAEIEADEVFMAEQASLAAALESRDVAALSEYAETCTICSGKDEVMTALAEETRRIEFSQPCLELAAVPQLGGPRKLEAIDQNRAADVCSVAAAEFPEDGVIRTTLGRIAQAGGDFSTAKASYDFGMERGVASAFGLAAYSHYAPPQGGEIDLDRAEELARQGADRGDWLSQEILTVLYSKDLVPGKTPEDAFDIAMNIAEEGNALAQFFVGYYYLTGTGTETSEADAVQWLEKAVGQGYTHAYSFLAELHEKGAGGEPDIEKAADLYWSALEKGDPTAADRLTTQIQNRDREVVRIIQQKLRELGTYRGAVDGIAGPSTVAAIRRYADSIVDQG